MIKICAFSDFHGILPIVPKCDVVVIAGDISPFIIQGNKIEMILWIKSIFNPWIESLDCQHVFLTPGNHDYIYEGITKKKLDELHNEVSHKLSVLINKGEQYIINGQMFKIFGTPYCHIFGNWPFMRSEDILIEKYKDIPTDLDILISHDSPYGENDIVLQLGRKNTGLHCGNMELRAAIEEKQPRFNLCGHIHSALHEFRNINNTKVINVSLMNETCDKLYYDILEFEI